MGSVVALPCGSCPSRFACGHITLTADGGVTCFARQKAGDYIFSTPAFAEMSSNEVKEALADLLLELIRCESDRPSKGIEIDAMLAVLDYMVKTPEQMNAVRELFGH